MQIYEYQFSDTNAFYVFSQFCLFKTFWLKQKWEKIENLWRLTDTPATTLWLFKEDLSGQLFPHFLS